MDSQVSEDLSRKGENPSHKSMKNFFDENCVCVVGEVARDVIGLQPPSTGGGGGGGASLGPVTPISNRETGDFPFHFTSPLTLVPKAVCFDVDPYAASIDDTPHTPKEGVFDPFAPGPDKLMLAPQHNKYLEESRCNVARRLHFDSSGKFVGDGNRASDAESISDEEMLLETVYGTLLEAIVSKQSEELLAEISSPDPVSDGFKTPDSAPRLNGVAETCPGAPVKPTRKLRDIDQGLCRKLEF